MHFPVMVYFVLFIVVHVALVFATGALRNLNHMYASLGSTDGMRYADNWTGFWISSPPSLSSRRDGSLPAPYPRPHRAAVGTVSAR